MKKEFESINKLYHYTHFDTAIKILESHSLRFGRLYNMNDIHENDKLYYVNSSGTTYNSFPSDVLDTIDYEMAKYRQISLTSDDKSHKKLGFDLHQMWGLYAKKGHGVCLVFDKDILCANLDKTINHGLVSYDETVESFYIALSDVPKNISRDIENQIQNVFFYKRKEWEHEQEYRLIKRCPHLKKEEYLDYGESLKFIILNSVIEDIDGVKFKEMIGELKKQAPQVPILVYGNGLLDYSLYNSNRSETIWNSSHGYDILIPRKNCDIDV